MCNEDGASIFPRSGLLRRSRVTVTSKYSTCAIAPSPAGVLMQIADRRRWLLARLPQGVEGGRVGSSTYTD